MHEILKQGRTTLSKYEIQEKEKLVYELFMKIAKRRGKSRKNISHIYGLQRKV